MAFKNDARHSSESNYWLTDFGARSGGEGEIGALVLGTYEFAEGVNEITLPPRPASLRRAGAVETDHPLIQLPLKLVHDGLSQSYASDPPGNKLNSLRGTHPIPTLKQNSFRKATPPLNASRTKPLTP